MSADSMCLKACLCFCFYITVAINVVVVCGVFAGLPVFFGFTMKFKDENVSFCAASTLEPMIVTDLQFLIIIN